MQELSLSWDSGDRTLALEPEAMQQLAALPRLASLTLHLSGGWASEPCSLAGGCLETSLTRLVLSGCCSQPLMLSVGSLTALKALELSGTSEAVTGELLVHVVRSLKALTRLVLERMGFRPEVRLPADYLFAQAATHCEALVEVQLKGLPIHGTGEWGRLLGWCIGCARCSAGALDSSVVACMPLHPLLQKQRSGQPSPPSSPPQKWQNTHAQQKTCAPPGHPCAPPMQASVARASCPNRGCP